MDIEGSDGLTATTTYDCTHCVDPQDQFSLDSMKSALSGWSRGVSILQTRLDEVDGQPGLIPIERQTSSQEQPGLMLVEERLAATIVGEAVVNNVYLTGKRILNLGKLYGCNPIV